MVDINNIKNDYLLANSFINYKDDINILLMRYVFPQIAFITLQYLIKTLRNFDFDSN